MHAIYLDLISSKGNPNVLVQKARSESGREAGVGEYADLGMYENMKRKSKRLKGNTSGERCYRRSTIWGRKFAIEKCRVCLDVYLYRGHELDVFWNRR